MTKQNGNRRGEWRRTLWVFLPLIPFGWIGGLGLLYAGLRARHRAWAAFGALYLILGLTGLAFVAADPDGDVDTWRIDVGMILSLAVMAASTAHSFGVRRSFLDRIDRGPDPRLEAAEQRLQQRQEALAIVREDPLRARELGIGRPDLPDAFHGGLVDLNHANAAAIEGLPRIDATTAARAVALREELQGFESLEDAGEILELPPATVELLRSRAVCLPY